MSLYSDLTEVLTPYANAIKGVKADLGDLSKLETETKTDLVSAINEAASSGGSGLTAEIKQALLQLASKVAYIDEDGQDYYDDLLDALYPPIPATAISLSSNSLTINALNSTQTLAATLMPANATDTVTWSSSDSTVATVNNGVVTAVGYGTATITATAGSVSATCSVTVAQVTLSSISAVYTQSGTVYSNATLNSLKSDLVVTATWSDTSTSTVNAADYTLSGTMTTGTSTITVSYGGQTDTFAVTVTDEWDVNWSYSDGMPTTKGFNATIDSVNNGATASIGDSGVIFSVVGKSDTNGNKITYSYPTTNAKSVFESEFIVENNNQILFSLSGDGTNGLGVRVQRSANYKGVYLATGNVIADMTLLKSLPNAGTRVKIRFVLDNGVGAVYIDDVLSIDNVDITTLSMGNITRFTFSNPATGTCTGTLVSMKLKLGRTS